MLDTVEGAVTTEWNLLAVMPQHLRAQPPRAFGFRQPAEWTRHEATWAAWPFDEEEWRGMLGSARDEFARFVATMARFEPVRLLVADDEAEGDARRRLAGVNGVTFLHVPLDDVWLRDSGPIFVQAPDGRVSFVHWAFNAWGRKFDWALDDEVPEALATHLGLDHFDVDVVLEGGSIDTDGNGTVLTTRQCLLEPSRNPHLRETDLAGLLADYLGFDRLVWLDRGLEGDHTDGHVDTIARFVAPGRVAACVASPDDEPNHTVLAHNVAILRRAGLDVVEVPVPAERRTFEGERLPLTYVNFCLVNGAVLVPQYGDMHDERALRIIGEAFPDRKAVGVDSAAIITSGGSLHCLTQQQPWGPFWSAPEGIAP